MALAPGTIGGLEVPILGPTRFSRETLTALRSHARATDLVVAHGSSTLPAVSAATAGLSTPFVYRSIGDPQAWATTTLRRSRIRLAVGRAAGVVALWRGSAVFWHERLGVPADRIRVIPNWVDTGCFPVATPDSRASARGRLRLPADGPIALCLGALTPEKRVDLAIRAAGTMPDHTLLVVGEGPQRAALSVLASRWPGRIHLLGSTQDPAVPLAAADVLVMPSRTEGQPAAAIEAGLTGIPVVATRVGGIPDIVVDGRSGILVDDVSPESLALAIADASVNRDAMGAVGRQHCLQHFDVARIGHMWLEFLQRVHTARST